METVGPIPIEDRADNKEKTSKRKTKSGNPGPILIRLLLASRKSKLHEPAGKLIRRISR